MSNASKERKMISTRRDSDSMNLLNSSCSVLNTAVLAAVSADSKSIKFFALVRLTIFFLREGSIGKIRIQKNDKNEKGQCKEIMQSNKVSKERNEVKRKRIREGRGSNGDFFGRAFEEVILLEP